MNWCQHFAQQTAQAPVAPDVAGHSETQQKMMMMKQSGKFSLTLEKYFRISLYITFPVIKVRFLDTRVF